MGLLDAILVKNSRNKTISKKKTLGEIKHHLNEFSCRNIPMEVCLSKTGELSADLIADHYSEGELPDNIYDILLIMFINYYIILHIDKYTGDYIINKDYIFNQTRGISEKVVNETVKNRKFKSFDLQKANFKSRDFINQLIDVCYKAGAEGCLKYLTFSIYSALQSVDKDRALSKSKIESIIQAVQAEKFLSLSQSDVSVNV